MADIAHAFKPRKKRRVFMWIFLALQVVFLAWIVIATVTANTGPSHADLASACYNHHWWPLFNSQQDCVTHYGNALNTAGDIGTGIGLALVIALWVAVDLILGVSYGVYRLSTRNRPVLR